MPAVDRKELLRVYRLPTWRPTDCPNYLTYRDARQYRKYAIGILPFLVLGRTKIRWVGERVDTLAGDSPGDKLMIVRYRDHRSMLRMIVNPLYLVINRFRTRGTARLELAFTEARWPDETLGAERFALGVHGRSGDPNAFFGAVEEAAKGAGARVAYASVERQTFSFLVEPRPNDPNPLTYPHTALVESTSESALRDLASSPALARALEKSGKSCLQLYRRSSPMKMLRGE